LKTVGSLKDKI